MAQGIIFDCNQNGRPDRVRSLYEPHPLSCEDKGITDPIRFYLLPEKNAKDATEAQLHFTLFTTAPCHAEGAYESLCGESLTQRQHSICVVVVVVIGKEEGKCQPEARVDCTKR